MAAKVFALGRGFVCAVLAGAGALLGMAAPSVAGNVVIQEIYGGGDNGGATYNFDYVVLYNRSSAAVPIAGWSVQYASATGNFGTASLKVDLPTGALPLEPGQFYLVRLGSNNTGVGAALPVTPDVTSGSNTTPQISPGQGKIALVRNTTLLPVVACPLGNPDIEDFIGYGATANCFEGAAPGATGNATTSTFRRNVSDGCIDTDQNGADTIGAAPVCRNTTIFAYCSVACCSAGGNCTVVASPSACNGSVFANATCIPNPCPQPGLGACCFNQNCFTVAQAQCLAQGGVYHGDGTTCLNRNCGTGACCSQAGGCGQTATAIACTANGGTFLGFGTSCNPNPCADPRGACCTATGCIILTQTICENQGNHYAGDNVGCGAVNCDTGACCSTQGVCTQVVIAAACTQGGGTFLGLGVPCLPSPCAPTTGACCSNAGACSQVALAAQCNGIFRGIGVACGADTCKGACCDTSNACTITGQGGCTGTFIGLGTVCNPSPCPITPPGACCLGNGSCTSVADAAACGGRFLGSGSTCGANTCAGVCCAGSVCLTITPNQCNALPWSLFVPTQLTCPGTLTSPCCKSDFNHVGGVGVQDIFDFLAAWFNSSPLCDIDGDSTVAVADIFAFLAAWFAGGC